MECPRCGENLNNRKSVGPVPNKKGNPSMLPAEQCYRCGYIKLLDDEDARWEKQLNQCNR